LLQYGLTDRPEVLRVEQVLEAKHGEVPPLVTIKAHDKVRQAIDVLQRFSISQAPVIREASGSDTVGPDDRARSERSSAEADVAGFVGSIRENALLDRIFRDPDALQADVAEVMGPPIALVEFDEPIEVAFEALQSGPAVLVVKSGQALGVLTRSDLLEFLAHRRP
jgi:cystathionine beta-synthase